MSFAEASSSGTFEDGNIAYKVAVTETRSEGLVLEIKLKNQGSKPVYLSNLDAPWRASSGLQLFLSTDAPALSAPSSWQSDVSYLNNDLGPGEIKIAPGQEVSGRFPLGERFAKVLKERKANDVYVYWSFPLKVYAEDPGSQKSGKNNQPIVLSRVGGFLTVKKQT